MRRLTLALATTMALISAACVAAPAVSPTSTPEAPATTSPAATESGLATASPTATASPIGSSPGTTDRPFPTPAIAGTPLPTSTPRSLVHLQAGGTSTHVQWEGLGFDIPAAWTFKPANIDEHYIFIVGFLGTAPSRATCVPTTGPGTATGVMCSPELNLGPHTVTMELETHDGPGPLEPMGYLAHPEPGSTTLDVDGVDALLSRPPLLGGSTSTVGLLIQSPTQIGVWLTMDAFVSGPDPALEQDVNRIFASVHFEPPVSSLPNDDATRRAVVARAVSEIAGTGEGFDCFPREPGQSRTTVVKVYPYQPEYNPPKPLRATCSTSLDATPIGFWKLTLTLEWGRPGDPATTYKVWTWLDRTGSSTSVMGTGQYPP